ncbi:MAG TPA: hypothetical protein PK177_09670, partial [Burkholderiaceae bacterium]|nr:hypothetical protein [Burkholderiaceae bacterium]
MQSAHAQQQTPADGDWLAAFGLDDLLPDALAAWRPLVTEALSFFLEQLPEQRSSEIVLGQLALGETASVAQRVVALLAQCPTLHKLGQMLARNRHLPAELRSQLQTLETMPSSLPIETIVERIRSELGPQQFEGPIELAEAPLAEASVAVVLPFCWRE